MIVKIKIIEEKVMEFHIKKINLMNIKVNGKIIIFYEYKNFLIFILLDLKMILILLELLIYLE